MKNNLYKAPPIEIKLSDLSRDHAPKWIQVLRPGTFYKDNVKIEISKKHILSMAKNHKANVRGVDIALDYAHNSDLEAAAWFRDIIVEEDGSLWAEVEWTKLGEEKVNQKEYRYISADFNFDYQDNETMKYHGPTLLGAGLTNRPVVKNMQPIILSEKLSDDNKTKENEMSDKEKKFEEENKALKEQLKELSAKLAKFEKNQDEKKFTEENEKLSEENKKLKKEVAEAKVKEEKAERKAKFDGMLSEGSVVEAQREAYMANDMEKFIENKSEVNLDEKGKPTTPKTERTESDCQDQVLKLADEKVEKNSELDYGDAIDQVLSENPKLNEEYKKVFA